MRKAPKIFTLDLEVIDNLARVENQSHLVNELLKEHFLIDVSPDKVQEKIQSNNEKMEEIKKEQEALVQRKQVTKGHYIMKGVRFT